MAKDDKVKTVVAALLMISHFSREGRPVSGAWLASRCGLKPRTLEATLQSLCRRGFLESVRGQRGGYKFPQNATFTLGDVVRAAAEQKRTTPNPPPSSSPIEGAFEIVDRYLSTGFDKQLAHYDTIPFSELTSAAAAKDAFTFPDEWIDFVI